MRRAPVPAPPEDAPAVERELAAARLAYAVVLGEATSAVRPAEQYHAA